jgi:hypothetical protein
MANTDLAIKIATSMDSSGFKKAETAVTKLNRSLKNLAGAFGLAYSSAKIVNFGKSSVRAFAEMSAEQDRLTRLMKVGTGASAAQVQALNNQASALENLGVVSQGNVTQVQSQLATFNLQASTIAKLTPSILDYVTAEKGATASTEEFKQMTNGLAQALNGNFASLTRVGFVIDQTTKDIIKNGNETERTAAIVKVLDSTYKGFNKSLRDTPIGQMQLLRNASEDARETIGEGLVDALMMLGGEGKDQVDSVGDSMAEFANYTADVIRGVGILTSKITALDNAIAGGAIGKLLAFNSKLGFTGLLSRLGADSRPSPRAGRFFGGSSIQGNVYDPVAAAKAKADKAAAALAKKQLDATKKLTAEQKKQNTLKKAATIFDLEQVELIAALKGKLSDEDRKRVELQFALLVGNTSEAQKLTYELAKAQGLGVEIARHLADLPDAKNPFASWEAYLDKLMSKARQVASMGSTAVVIAPTPSVPSGNVSAPYTGTPFGQAGSAAARQLGTPFGQAGSNGSGFVGTPFGQAPIVVQIDGKAIATALQDTSMSGITSNINRTSGGFGL